MRAQFDPTTVQRIKVEGRYNTTEHDEPYILIVAPDGWSCDRDVADSATVLVRPSSQRTRGPGNVNQRAFARSGNVYQAGRDMVVNPGRVVTDEPRGAVIYLPGPSMPDITSV